MEDNSNIIRSSESIHRVYLIAKNTTDRPVDVFWINYDGELDLYSTMEARSNLSLNTFVSHPWVFVDANTGEQLHINGQSILWPLPLIVRTADNQLAYRRKRYDIHLPLCTLQKNALWKIVSLLRTEQDISHLEIPNNLVIELENIFKIYKDHRARRDNDPDAVADEEDDDIAEDDGDDEWEDEEDEDDEGEHIENDDDDDDDDNDNDDDIDDFSEDEEWVDVDEPADSDIIVHDGSISPQLGEEEPHNRNNDNHRIL